MVRLINWKRASKVEKENIKKLLKELSYYDVLIVPRVDGYIEYIKSTDLDTNERIIIRRERKNKLHKELVKLSAEGFKIKVMLHSQSKSSF